MNTTTPRSITPEDRLRIFAMITVAAERYGECRRMERSILRLLKRPDSDSYLNDFLGDLLYAADTEGSISEAAFDAALKRAGYVVEPDDVADEVRGMIASLRAADEAKSDPIFNDAAGLLAKLLAMRGPDKPGSTE